MIITLEHDTLRIVSLCATKELAKKDNKPFGNHWTQIIEIPDTILQEYLLMVQQKAWNENHT